MFERDAAFAVLFDHGFDIVDIHPFHLPCKAQEPRLLGIFSKSRDVKSGGGLQEAFIDWDKSHFRQPGFTQREVPSDFFRDVR